MHVVEHEHEGTLAPSQGIAEPRHQCVGEVGVPERGRQGVLVERFDLVERRRDRADQKHRVVVAGVERDPGELAVVVRQPLAKQRRLPVARRRGHQQRRSLAVGDQPRDQVVAAYERPGDPAPALDGPPFDLRDPHHPPDLRSLLTLEAFVRNLPPASNRSRAL